ncbi:MAG: elongation factor 4, partial [Deltaproteobacteria bacterium]|nr:elongation factor 4 [Deltaproteobacteria bacterium]
AACEGALLVVDATQGIQAQTIANALAAVTANLEIVPVINKIDLPSSDIEGTCEELSEALGFDGTQALQVSAKTGQGVPELIEAIVKRLPPPRGERDAPLRALIFDSWFDSFEGVIVLVRIVDGELTKGMPVRLMNRGKDFIVQRLGLRTPREIETDSLSAGEVGFAICGIKEVADARIGETITSQLQPATEPLKGFQEAKPMVFAGLYPVDSQQYEQLKDALRKLKLNDASFSFEPETSLALGFGFRCGFLGSLHLEIIQERLEREYTLALISTAPTVVYEVVTKKGEVIAIDSPAKLPDPMQIEELREPYALASIHAPKDSLGNLMALCQERRGEQLHMEYFGRERVMLRYRLPFSEMMVDFYDQLKSLSRGYASLDYEIEGYRTADLIKLNILINGDPVDALSSIVHRDQAYNRGKELAKRMREMIPRQQYEVAIQAAIGGRIIARETVKAMRKDVTAKCYGGDITRKRKLLEKQKEGKRRMKQVGSVEIPQEVFQSVLKTR